MIIIGLKCCTGARARKTFPMQFRRYSYSLRVFGLNFSSSSSYAHETRAHNIQANKYDDAIDGNQPLFDVRFGCIQMPS